MIQHEAGENRHPPIYDYDYISDDLPIYIGEWENDVLDSVFILSRFQSDFIWVRMLEGSIELEVDGVRQIVEEGETIFINSMRVHTYYGVPKGHARYRILIARPDAVSNPLLNQKLQKMIDDARFSSIVIHPANPLFSADMDAILELNRHRPQEFECEILSHYLSQLRQIIRIYHHTNPDETISRDADLDTLREMMAFIGENYREEISLNDIADAGKVSRSKCTRLFRQYLQKSPIHHLQTYRLDRSVYYLCHTNMRVSEVARCCGFNQQSYFNRLFMRSFGMTPKQMRMKEGQKENSDSD
ncbi:MAG: helix-turn-helix domain-containing protein [Solobacterium sp.]|nr:helix-turn-helix domain-containing protein [Solobacterium sp.]